MREDRVSVIIINYEFFARRPKKLKLINCDFYMAHN